MDNVKTSFPIVGLGASAGGLRAVTTFLDALQPDLGIAYVLVQHLAPDHVSELDRLLQSHTAMPVHQLKEEEVLQPDTVYVIPPGRVLELKKSEQAVSVTVSDRVSKRERRFPIDRFFRSLAQVREDRAVCVIFSGTGTDGTSGLKAVKEQGGLCLVQEPAEAGYDGMPRNAVSTGLVDVVDTVAVLAERIATLDATSVNVTTVREAHEEALQSIFVELRRQTGHVFGGYKRATILRRLTRRMQVTGIDSLEAYAAHLKDHPDETRALFKDILISVTSFFRDPAAFAYLEHHVIPDLFANKTSADTIRVWVPGCATGEEALSIAMLLLEHRQTIAARPEIQVFASDVDDEALQFARRGMYPASISSDVSKDRLSHFFSVQTNGYVVNPKLMDTVLFAEHNLVSDPPFSKLDLVSCRNVLIYMSRELQDEVFGRLHYALNPDGVLFLGRSESVDAVPTLFSPIHARSNLFRRLDSPVPEFYSRTVATDVPRFQRAPDPLPRRTLGLLHRRLITDKHAPPSVLLDIRGKVLHVTGSADPYMRLRAGRTTLNMLDIVASPLRTILRPAFYRAQQGESTSVLWEGDLSGRDENDGPQGRLRLSGKQNESDTEHRKGSPARSDARTPASNKPDASTLRSLTAVGNRSTDNQEEPATGEQDGSMAPVSSTGNGAGSGRGNLTRVRISTSPVKDSKSGETYVLVVFDEQSLASTDWQVRGRHSDEQKLFESMEDELRETQQRMRTLMEEHETSTEELQTSNEELQSMNEELRSASEELQIRKEELQSSNEELLTVNQELKVKVKEVNQVNADLENLLESTNIATVFLTRDLLLKRYTPSALDLLGIQIGDVGIPIHRIPHSLKDTSLHKIASTVYRTLQPERREVASGEKTFLMNVMPYRTTDDRIDGIVMTFVDITDRVELRNERDEAYEASEMKSKMIANLSHEVRTPMTSLLGFSEVLQEEAKTPDARRFGQLIHKSSLRLQNTLESVLRFSRLEAGKESTNVQKVNIVEELRETYHEQRKRAEARGITLRLDVADALPPSMYPPDPGTTEAPGADTGGRDIVWSQVWCRTDPGAVQRILRNLTGNAIKYTPAGGDVILRCVTGRQGVMIEVEDTGMGMTRTFQERMYEPFSQESEGHAREFEGVGLGLAIVLKLTELIEGRLEVESTAGQGTRFALFLPRTRRKM